MQAQISIFLNDLDFKHAFGLMIEKKLTFKDLSLSMKTKVHTVSGVFIAMLWHTCTYIKRMSRTLLLLNSLENIKMHPVLEKFKTICSRQERSIKYIHTLIKTGLVLENNVKVNTGIRL